MTKQSYILKGLRRDIGKRVDTTSNGGRGFTTVPDGHEIADVELTVDPDALARRLGVKAMKNTRGFSTIAWGLIKVRVTNRKRVPA